MAGPITRLPLIIVELRAMAAPRSSWPTSDGSTAPHTGALRALPMPTARTQPKMSTRDGLSAPATMAARTSENTSCSVCRTMSSLRRSRASATMPPTTDSSSSGPSWAKASSADERARPGQLVGVRAEHHGLHPRADVRGERAQPHEAELAVGQGRAGGPDAADVVVALGEGFLGVLDDRLVRDVQGPRRRVMVPDGGASDQVALGTVGASMHAPTLPADAPRSARPTGPGPACATVVLVGLGGALALAWGTWQVGALADRRFRLRWLDGVPVARAPCRLPPPVRRPTCCGRVGVALLSGAWVLLRRRTVAARPRPDRRRRGRHRRPVDAAAPARPAHRQPRRLQLRGPRRAGGPGPRSGGGGAGRARASPRRCCRASTRSGATWCRPTARSTPAWPRWPCGWPTTTSRRSVILWRLVAVGGVALIGVGVVALARGARARSGRRPGAGRGRARSPSCSSSAAPTTRR